jgi:hypothetical protein
MSIKTHFTRTGEILIRADKDFPITLSIRAVDCLSPTENHAARATPSCSRQKEQYLQSDKTSELDPVVLDAMSADEDGWSPDEPHTVDKVIGREFDS